MIEPEKIKIEHSDFWESCTQLNRNLVNLLLIKVNKRVKFTDLTIYLRY